MKVRIRKANGNDAGFVEACAQAAYAPYVARIGRKPAPMIADFSQQIESGYVEIVEGNREPVGFCVWYLRENSLFLENIAVHPAFQNNGIAGQVFGHLERQARRSSRDMIELYTNEKMTENLILYPILGYHEVERRLEDGFSRVYFRKLL